MAHKGLILAFSMIVATSPAWANHARPAPGTPAPAGTPETRYCMYVEAITGSRIETIQCWTREEWADQGVDVDQDWSKEGVRVIG